MQPLPHRAEASLPTSFSLPASSPPLLRMSVLGPHCWPLVCTWLSLAEKRTLSHVSSHAQVLLRDPRCYAADTVYLPSYQHESAAIQALLPFVPHVSVVRCGVEDFDYTLAVHAQIAASIRSALLGGALQELWLSEAPCALNVPSFIGYLLQGLAEWGPAADSTPPSVRHLKLFFDLDSPTFLHELARIGGAHTPAASSLASSLRDKYRYVPWSALARLRALRSLTIRIVDESVSTIPIQQVLTSIPNHVHRLYLQWDDEYWFGVPGSSGGDAVRAVLQDATLLPELTLLSAPRICLAQVLGSTVMRSTGAPRPLSAVSLPIVNADELRELCRLHHLSVVVLTVPPSMLPAFALAEARESFRRVRRVMLTVDDNREEHEDNAAPHPLVPDPSSIDIFLPLLLLLSTLPALEQMELNTWVDSQLSNDSSTALSSLSQLRHPPPRLSIAGAASGSRCVTVPVPTEDASMAAPALANAGDGNHHQRRHAGLLAASCAVARSSGH